ncbi:transposase, partial [Candidatus Daviesbacteria bacterium]|nr:transposase [Candidatus Daviesbacteria bacterium]
VNILCFCLMPNHIHLLIQQLEENGISEFMRKFSHSYTKYWNIKNNHQGPLLQAMFKAVLVETDEQLLHLSRYIHLNPLVSSVIQDLNMYPWSSYLSYLDPDNTQHIAKNEILEFFNSAKDYEKFVLNQADYGTTLEMLKHSTIDIAE